MNKPGTLFPILLLSIAPLLGAATAVEEKTVPAKGVRAVAVDNVNGRIEVVAADRADIHIRASKSADTAAQLVNLAFSAVLGADGRLTVETKPARAYLWGVFPLKVGGRIDYRIEVPGTLPVSLVTVNGDILATGLQGELHAETVNGDIKAEAGPGKISLESVNGGIHVRLAGASPDLRAETINGGITLKLEEGVDARYAFETVSGNIRFVPERIKVKGSGPKAIEGVFGGGGGSVQAETVSGSIVVHLGGGAAI
jgi:hypothetical protein